MVQGCPHQVWLGLEMSWMPGWCLSGTMRQSAAGREHICTPKILLPVGSQLSITAPWLSLSLCAPEIYPEHSPRPPPPFSCEPWGRTGKDGGAKGREHISAPLILLTDVAVPGPCSSSPGKHSPACFYVSCLSSQAAQNSPAPRHRAGRDLAELAGMGDLIPGELQVPLSTSGCKERASQPQERGKLGVVFWCPLSWLGSGHVHQPGGCCDLH